MKRQDIALMIGLSHRHIDNLVLDGMPREKSGRSWEYGAEAVAWYYQRRVAALEERASGPTLAEARVRKELAQAERIELELAALRGDLISGADHQAELNRTYDWLRATLQAFPGRWAPHCVGLRRVVDAQRVIEDGIGEVLGVLSAGGPHEEEGDADPDTPERARARTPRRRRGARTATGAAT